MAVDNHSSGLVSDVQLYNLWSIPYYPPLHYSYPNFTATSNCDGKLINRYESRTGMKESEGIPAVDRWGVSTAVLLPCNMIHAHGSFH